MSTIYDERGLKEVQSFFNTSGCALNSSRRIEPVKHRPKMEDENEETLSGIPKLDLMNFEDPQYEESKYVLTSPRSLEACSRLGVKPVDLLYKPLAEFQEELLPQDVPLRTIYNIYDEHEQNRERKLALGREERQRILDEEKGRPTNGKKPVISQTKKLAPKSARTSQRNSKLSGKTTMSKSVDNLDKGSLQRKRTAWTTSVGHERVTNDEINQRVKDLHNESTKLRQELLSRKEAKATQRKTKKTERPKSARAAINRSYSASDLSLAGTSMMNRTHLSTARPISNSKLRKALPKSEVKGAEVTPEDEKILSLIMSKHEDERAELKEKLLREIIWERQKKAEEAVRLASEMRRRRMLAEGKRTNSVKKTDQEAKRKQEERSLLEEQERLMNESKRRWAMRYSSQRKNKDQKFLEKMEKDQLRKRIQASNVRALEDEEEEMKELVRQKQQHQVVTAAQKKEAKMLEESMRVMMKNRSERRQFEDRWNSLLKDTQESIDLLTESMNAKDSKHKSKYEQTIQRRENEMMLSRLDREKRALQAKLAQQQQESEMEEWRDSILTAREVADRQAHETLAQTIERKARKVHEDRARKMKGQKKNIKKINQETRDWTKQMESLIESKDRKSENIQLEKDLTIQQSRHLAASSQKLRVSLRNKYGGESFDQKAFKAEMYNKFETGTTFLSAAKNNSRVNLH